MSQIILPIGILSRAQPRAPARSLLALGLVSLRPQDRAAWFSGRYRAGADSSADDLPAVLFRQIVGNAASHLKDIVFPIRCWRLIRGLVIGARFSIGGRHHRAL